MDFSILIISFLFLLSLLLFSTTRNKIHNLPPGPINLPIIGNLHRFGKLPHHSLHKLSRKHGPIMYLKLGSIPTIVASSPSAAKEFLKTHDIDCCTRPPLTSLRKLSYNFCDIAFSPYNEQWRELRKICILHLFSTKKVASFRDIREEEVDRMISRISSSENEEVNLSELLLELANDITCRTALGKRHESGGRLYWILQETQEMLGGFFFADYIPKLGFLDAFTGMRERLEKNFRELDGFYQQVIDEHSDPTRTRRDEDVVDVLLEMKKKERNLTDDHIKGLLMNIFIAGSDTSSSTVEWAMTELMRHPNSIKKAQDEVRNIIGNKAKADETDLDQLHYLKSVVKETMRLHPAGPLLIQRETIRPCKIDGYDIPAKSRLFINAFAIARSTDAWARPHEFLPERFENGGTDFRGHDLEFIPFGAGRRICPGMDSGILVVELALANLLYQFDWTLPKGMLKEEIDMGESAGAAVHKRLPLHLVATKYQEVKG